LQALFSFSGILEIGALLGGFFAVLIFSFGAAEACRAHF